MSTDNWRVSNKEAFSVRHYFSETEELEVFLQLLSLPSLLALLKDTIIKFGDLL